MAPRRERDGELPLRRAGRALRGVAGLDAQEAYALTQDTADCGLRTADPAAIESDWRGKVAPFVGPDPRRAIGQLITTLALLGAALVVMYEVMSISYWLTLLVAVPAAGLLVRTFIIMHDCAHGSFLPWRRASETLGFWTGVLTLTPFDQWRRDHALHHASSGDLDRRGHGDVQTLTVNEYLARTRMGRLRYRLRRHPLLLLLGGPIWLMLGQRFRPRGKATGDKQRSSVMRTNLAIAALAAAAILLWGWQSVVAIYLPVYVLAASAGIWLFYVQHQFEDAYWERREEWDYAEAAIRGSSHLKLPRLLQWFTGSIGLHHVHHLAPRIPNFRLQECHEADPAFQAAPVITIASGIAALRLALWDETRHRLIRFDELPAGPIRAG